MSESDEKEKAKLAEALRRMAAQASGPTPLEPPVSHRPLTPGSGSSAPLKAVPPAPQPAKSRPVAPSRTAQPSSGNPFSEDQPAFDVDDDAVIAPAPTPDVFLPKHRPAPPPRSPLLRSMFLRRTLIPIMLTAGIMFPTLGLLWFTTDTTSPFRRAGDWVPFTLIGAGMVLLLLGLVNALHVKHLMQAARR